MTPPVFIQKIDSLRNCVERIEGKKPFSAQDLQSNFDLQDIISINLERAIQVSIDIATHLISERNGPTPATMAESFLELARQNIITPTTAERLVKAVGLRNILVHEYSKINWGIVAEVAEKHLDTFRDFAQEVLALKNKE
jgi:uncharacterized protein YutE (UPF0331/DUF86 family)